VKNYIWHLSHLKILDMTLEKGMIKGMILERGF